MSRHLAFGLIVLAGLTGVFPGLLWRGEILFERDLHQMLFGQYAALAGSVRAGAWPLWDSGPGFGQPLLANPAAQVLYPPTWLCLVLPPARVYGAYLVLHLVLGAWATRALAQHFGASPRAALLAALVWLLSGPILSLANLWHHLAGACLMPLVWLAASAVRREPSVRRAILLGGALGLQVLAGSFDMVVLTLAVIVASGLVEEGEKGPRSGWRLAKAVLTAMGVATALSTGLLLPLLEVWHGSARVALGESMRTAWSLHPALLPQIALPFFPHLLPLAEVTRAALFEGGDPFLASVYLGLVTLPLAAAGAWSLPRRQAAFLFGAFAICVLTALGRHGLLYPLLVAAVPGLASLRYPSKATVLLPLLLALLAARGFDGLLGSRPDPRVRLTSLIVAGTGASLAALAAVVLWRAPPHWLFSEAAWSGGVVAAAGASAAAWRLLIAASLGFGALAVLRQEGKIAIRATALIALCGLDLGLAHHALNATASAARFTVAPAVLAPLLEARSRGPLRIHTWDYMARVLGKNYRRKEPSVPARSAPAGTEKALAGALARRAFLSPPTATEWGLQGSYDRDWLGLQPRGVRNLGLFFQTREETPDMLRLLRIGGVSYTIALHEVGLEDLLPVATLHTPFAGAVYVFGVPTPLPLLYVVGSTRIADGGAALRLLVSPDFDPRSEVVLPDGRETRSEVAFVGEVRIKEERVGRRILEVASSGPSHVVVLDAWDPGWRAFVDGQEATVRRANVGFIAVPVPEGIHRVEVVYRPRGLALGIAATLGALTVVLGALFVGPVWERREEGPR